MDEIPELLQRMADLLRDHGEEGWANGLQHLSTNYATDPDEMRIKVFRLYGGMGSLNDLVLQNQNGMLQAENEALDKLRSALYVACQKSLNN